jgi:leader peptidase (prepilin peptidase)/N-methyltransferase
MIPWYENIPVLSFLALRARCRGCAAPISWRYPFVEALTGALYGLAAWLLVVRPAGGWKDPSRYVLLGIACLYLGALVALTFIDLAHRILPDRITKPGIAAGAILSVLVPSLQPTRWIGALPDAGAALVLSLAGAAVGYGSLWLVGWLGERAFRKEAMGLGDCKLLAMIGAFTGPAGALLAAACGLVLGLVMGLVEQARTKDATFPFGPALAAGGAVVFLAPDRVRRAFRDGLDLLQEPRVGLGAAVAMAVVLFLMRRRFPKPVLLLLFVLLAAFGAAYAFLPGRR